MTQLDTQIADLKKALWATIDQVVFSPDDRCQPNQTFKKRRYSELQKQPG
jgi:hypothetical protein